MNAFEVVSAAPEATRVAAGGPDERAPTDHGAVLEAKLVARRIHRHDARTEPDLDLLLLPVGCGTEHQRLERLVAGEVLLRERGPLVRQEVLGADHENRAHELLLAQHDRSLRAALARTDDDDVCSTSGHRQRATLMSRDTPVPPSPRVSTAM